MLGALLVTRLAVGQVASSWPSDLLRADHAAAGLSLSAGLAKGLSNVLADDAVLLYPGAPVVRTRSSILALLEAQPVEGIRVQWDPVFGELSKDGSLAVFYGTTSSVPGDSGARVGRFESAWRKGENGSWRIIALCLTGIPGALTPEAGSAVGKGTVTGLTGSNAFVTADRRFAERAAREGAGVAFEAFASTDGVLAGPASHPYVRGPKAIRALLESSGTTARWKWWPVLVQGDSADGLGLTVGEAEIRDSVGGHEEVSLTKYMTLWRVAGDGTIRFVADAGNGRP